MPPRKKKPQAPYGVPTRLTDKAFALLKGEAVIRGVSMSQVIIDRFEFSDKSNYGEWMAKNLLEKMAKLTLSEVKAWGKTLKSVPIFKEVHNHPEIKDQRDYAALEKGYKAAISSMRKKPKK